MNIQKFTQKSLEAIQEAQNIAIENQNSQVEEQHILLALLEQEDSLIKELFKKIGVSENFVDDVRNDVDKLPRMTGGSRPNNGIYVSQDVDLVLTNSEKIAKNMKDEYVSVEHLFLALLAKPNNELKQLFKNFDITRNKFLQALSTVRGNQRVTSDNPEATYDSLKKYGEELVEKARNQKLDPVIGRAEEIQ